VWLRLEVGRLGVDATRHEVTVRGGAGYLAGGATARRFREAAFLPIQSPTEAQLRWELSRSE
jgi:alkylation response protein AidB-like acyl-CoA dehydrogenase